MNQTHIALLEDTDKRIKVQEAYKTGESGNGTGSGYGRSTELSLTKKCKDFNNHEIEVVVNALYTHIQRNGVLVVFR